MYQISKQIKSSEAENTHRSYNNEPWTTNCKYQLCKGEGIL